jgi:hypothetical protein
MRIRALGFALALLTTALPCAALDDSRHGPFYVQGTVPLGINYWNFVSRNGYGWTGWRPDLEFGYHFSGRHDGIVLGLRQAFIVTAVGVSGDVGATTALRYGYDIPISIGDFEITVAPYGTLGLGYVFHGPTAGLEMSWGIDGKFFFWRELYAFARPFEMGFQCFHDTGICALGMVFGAGVGFAFPEL